MRPLRAGCVHVEAGAGGTTITANRARANGNYGIAAFAPVVDGGGNRAPTVAAVHSILASLTAQGYSMEAIHC